MRTVVTIHGIGVFGGQGAWQKQAREVLEPHFTCISVKYPHYRWLGPMSLLLEPWILIPGLAAVFFCYRRSWLPRIPFLGHLWPWIALVFVLSHFGTVIRRSRALEFVVKKTTASALFGYRLGLAALNAFVLGKVILLGEAVHAGERFGEKRLAQSVLYKSAVFASLLVCFDIVEEVIVGLVHGKSFFASIPQLGGGGLEGKILVGIMAFVVLIPLFLFTEVARVLGKETLNSLILHDRSKADAA